MDVTFSNVLEGTRQYFMGLPKQAATATVSGSGTQPTWSPMMAASRSDESHTDSRPSSATTSTIPPRPPSEPLEPEPHIIHKATVMREAAEKRREQPEEEDEDLGELSPPSHIIHKLNHHGPPTVSPAPAPQAPSPSPARPPSAAAPSHQNVPSSSSLPSTPPTSSVHTTHADPAQYRSPAHRVQTPSSRPPDHFAPGRPPDPYTANRPPESYMRYHYETNVHDGRGPPVVSPQPSARHSPQTYARISSTMPQHASSRLRDMTAPSPLQQRFATPPSQPQLLPNDRVPPIHHPHAQITQRVPSADGRAQYPPLVQHREPSPYSRTMSHYDRHPPLPQRKYDPQQAYSGYRPAPVSSQPTQSHRLDSQHQVQYRHPPVDPISSNYASRTLDRVPMPQPHPHDISRHAHEGHSAAPRKTEYLSRPVDTRMNYNYPVPSTSARYAQNPPAAAVPAVPSSPLTARTVQRPNPAPKPSYEYPSTSQVQSSPSRAVAKAGYPNNQSRMTVSVTSLVNQMNQTKQKRESPLDLSVKTVKNSADSSTTQDDLIDSATSSEIKTVSLQPRPSSSSRHVSASGYVESHKVDFAPDFTQYRERNINHTYPAPSSSLQPSHVPPRYNGSYESSKPIIEPNPIESRHHLYSDRSKYNNVPTGRSDLVSRVDLTRPVIEERRTDNRIRDDRNFVIEERKRPAGPIINNIPEKMVRYETWTADSRISDRMSQSAREQRELMSRPVYSYSSHKQIEAYQSEHKRALPPTVYRDHHSQVNQRNAMYPNEVVPRERHDYHSHYHDRNLVPNNRHIIQKIPSHRDIPPHHYDLQNGVPADKRVLSILRNSLETKQGFAEPIKPKQIPDLIVIDDVDDSVIEITDLTKDTDTESANKNLSKPLLDHKNTKLEHHIQMPKAVDSIARDSDSDYQRLDNAENKGKSPENDVASRIRTKAELKVMPPTNDNPIRHEFISNTTQQSDKIKLLPKSQKQHLFNQIREDYLRLESVIKTETNKDTVIREVKTELMNIDEIEKDAVVPIKTECILENLHCRNEETSSLPAEDLDWANACDNFMEQLKSGCHKKKIHRRRLDLENNNSKTIIIPKDEPIDFKETEQTESCSLPPTQVTEKFTDIVIKKEPIDFDEIIAEMEPVPENEQKPKIDEKEVELKSEKDINEKSSSKLIDNSKILPPADNETSINNETVSDSLKRKKKIVSDKKQSSNEKTKLSNKRIIGAKENENRKLKTPKKITNRDVESTDDIKPKVSKEIKEQKRDEGDDCESKLPRKTIDDKKESNDVSKAKKTPDAKEAKTEKGNTESKKITDLAKKTKGTVSTKNDKVKPRRKSEKFTEKSLKDSKSESRPKVKVQKSASLTTLNSSNSKDSIGAVIKEETESTDDDEPLIKSKLMKEKELKYQLLKDLSEKSAYVKLECFDVDMNKNTRLSIDSLTKDKEERQSKGKTRLSRTKGKSVTENIKNHKDSTSDSDDDDLSVASRLRLRKTIKTEDIKESPTKTSSKSSPFKKLDSSSTSSSSTPLRKAGFGDGSDFHPGWEEELYKYKRSLRMPPRLIAIPRGRSGGPFVRRSGAFFSRGSTSLPDLDPAPLSPAPSSAPSAATDDFFARRQEKLNLDSDLESNSSYSAANRLHYDSEASSSTVFSSTVKKKANSIVDVLIQKCGKKEDGKKKNKEKEKDDKLPKVIPKSSNTVELLPTPSLGLVKSNKDGFSAKKEKLMEEIFYLGAFRKETVSAFRDAFIKDTDGLIGATEEFAPVVLKSRTRTESRVIKQRATIKEVFGDERPASAPPTCTDEKEQEEMKQKPLEQIKHEPADPETKQKLKARKLAKDKKFRRSNSIRDGLRSTMLKRNDAKGRLMRLKKRNSLIKTLNNKRIKDGTHGKIRKPKLESSLDENDKPKEEVSSGPSEVTTKKRLKRLFGRRKFSSGFDYIRKKKKIIRRDENGAPNKVRRATVKPNPESVHDIHKEIKGWFINKSIGETHLHRAARLGYMDCVAYCLEKLEAEPSAKDNAGYTPLHFAAAKGHVRIARLLLQYGADVSAAAKGGIRPLHEACENSHIEVIRLLLSYGADPLLGTYAGQTPEELTEGLATRFLKLHIADVQGLALEPWRFPPPGELIVAQLLSLLCRLKDCYGRPHSVMNREELGCDPLSSPPPSSPPPPPDSMVEIQCTEAPLPPFYSLNTAPGQPVDGLWCLLQDLTSFLQIKSKDSLLKQIHCGSGSPKELLREIRTQEFLERAQCHQLLGAGEKVNVRASKVSLVRVTDKLRQLLKIETVLVS